MIRVDDPRDLAEASRQPAQKARLRGVRMHEVELLAPEQADKGKQRLQILPRLNWSDQSWNGMKRIRAPSRPLNPLAVGITSQVHIEPLPIMPFGGAKSII